MTGRCRPRHAIRNWRRLSLPDAQSVWSAVTNRCCLLAMGGLCKLIWWGCYLPIALADRRTYRQPGTGGQAGKQKGFVIRRRVNGDPERKRLICECLLDIDYQPRFAPSLIDRGRSRGNARARVLRPVSVRLESRCHCQSDNSGTPSYQNDQYGSDDVAPQDLVADGRAGFDRHQALGRTRARVY